VGLCQFLVIIVDNKLDRIILIKDVIP